MIILMITMKHQEENQNESRGGNESTHEGEPSCFDDGYLVRDLGRSKFVRTAKPGKRKQEYNILNMIHILQSVEDVLLSANEKANAMKNEDTSLLTWSLIDLPDGYKAIGCQWMVMLKRNKW